MDFDLEVLDEESTDVGGVMGTPPADEPMGEGAERLELGLVERGSRLLLLLLLFCGLLKSAS